jgi:P-type conjugative transfer protein TrbJ
MNRFPGCAAIALVATLMLSTSAFAWKIVYDPTNYAQNALQAARAMQQLAVQKKQLQKTLDSLKSLNLKDPGQAAVAQRALRNALRSTEAAGNSVRTLQSKYPDVFPDEYTNEDHRKVAERNKQWYDAEKTSWESMSRLTKSALDSLEGQSQTTADVLNSSRGSDSVVGNLQGVQQLLSTTITNQQTTMTLMAQQANAEAIRQSAEASRRQRAMQRKAEDFKPGTIGLWSAE